MKKRAIMHKMLSVLFSAILIFNLLSICVSAENSDKYSVANDVALDYSILNTETDNIYNKIHFYLDDYENTTIDDMNELVEATAKLANSSTRSKTKKITNSNEKNKLKLTVQFASDFTDTTEYKAFAKERENLNTIEEVHEFRSRLNAFSKVYHNQIIANNISLLEDFDYNSVEAVGYSPFVILDIDADNIGSENLLAIAESKDISNISISNVELPDTDFSLNDALESINAYEIVESETYTGDGIRIGVYEKSICNVNNINLSNKSITIENPNAISTAHATAVTSIIALIAPDAEYYVSNVFENRIGLQWFIDMGCDIINCSFSYYNNGDPDANGNYSDGVKEYRNDIDGIYDYQVLTHFITVVKSSGNHSDDQTESDYNPQNKIGSPGYAHNVITVGGLSNTTDLKHSSNASYVTPSGCIKPNISAVNLVVVPNIDELWFGTSFSAPQVAGCVALLMESDANYCVYPERTLSLIASTAKKTDDYIEDAGNFNQKVGAGAMDLLRMLNSDTYHRISNANGNSGSELTSVTIYLQEGKQLQVGLAWLATAVNSSSTGVDITDVIVTDYDLRIYSPSNDVLYSSCASSNVELIRLTAEEYGNYRIVVYQYGQLDNRIDAEWLFLTYNTSD